ENMGKLCSKGASSRFVKIAINDAPVGNGKGYAVNHLPDRHLALPHVDRKRLGGLPGVEYLRGTLFPHNPEILTRHNVCCSLTPERRELNPSGFKDGLTIPSQNNSVPQLPINQ